MKLLLIAVLCLLVGTNAEDTAVCKDTSVGTGFNTFEFEFSVRVNFDGFTSYSYPSVVASSTGAFRLIELNPYGAPTGKVGFYINTKSGIGAGGNGVGKIETAEPLIPGQWHTLRIQKGRRFISIAVDDTPPVIATLDSSYTDEQFEMQSPGIVTLGDGITGQAENLCWTQTDPPTPLTFGAMQESDLGASMSVLLGAIGDTVYKCGYFGNSSFTCMKNVFANRGAWELLLDNSEADAVEPKESVTVSDGVFTADPAGVTFTGSGNNYLFPNSCDCP